MSDIVQVSIRIAARPATVYRFLSEPDFFRRWQGEAAELDPSAGGRLRVPYPDGVAAVGKVLEMVPDRRVVWAWGMEDGAHGLPPDSTRIIIEIEDAEDGWTTVTLTHEGVPADHRDGTRAGWRHFTSVLADRAARAQLADRLGPLVRAFEKALNAPDAAERVHLLEQCVEEHGTFRDAAGVARDRNELSAFIGGIHGFRPGARFELSDEVAQSHDWVRFTWRGFGPDGTPLGSGMDVARVTPAGRFDLIVGFWDS